MVGNHTVKGREREFLLECIELYRELPALWQTKSKVYYDRDKKNQAYDILLAKYNKMFPEATKEDLKRRINSLRTNYRKELKKCVNSTYVPTLWYFQEISFLRELESPSDSDSSVDQLIKAETDGEREEQQIEIVSIHECDSEPPTLKRKTKPVHTDDYKKVKKNEQTINLSHERLTDLKDEYYHWGIACAEDLRKMERTQQLYAKKAIAEIIMEAQLGLLSRDSVKINENSFIPSVQFPYVRPHCQCKCSTVSCENSVHNHNKGNYC